MLTLYIGLGAMTGGALDVTNSNMAAPLLGARASARLLFAIISAIAFTTVLGTVAGLIVAAAGAVVHDLLTGFFKIELTDHEKVRVGRIGAVVVGVHRDRARHRVREDERHVPGRLGVQRRGLGQYAVAGDAAVLEAERRGKESSPASWSA